VEGFDEPVSQLNVGGRRPGRDREHDHSPYLLPGTQLDGVDPGKQVAWEGVLDPRIGGPVYLRQRMGSGSNGESWVAGATA
jgi:hypothetical protein